VANGELIETKFTVHSAVNIYPRLEFLKQRKNSGGAAALVPNAVVKLISLEANVNEGYRDILSKTQDDGLFKETVSPKIYILI
jgi:hypothetical protein